MTSEQPDPITQSDEQEEAVTEQTEPQRHTVPDTTADDQGLVDPEPAEADPDPEPAEADPEAEPVEDEPKAKHRRRDDDPA